MDYNELAQQIRELDGAQFIGFTGSPSERLPLYRIIRGKGKKVLLSGAVHGDEPAGTFAILDFFRNHAAYFEDEFEFTAFPCVNPWGYQHVSRMNAAGLNINRHFRKGSEAAEVRLIAPMLEEYAFAMDLHEDSSEVITGSEEPEGDSPESFYLWETCADRRRRVGYKIVANVEAAGIAVCQWPEIYGDRSHGGVISYPEDCGSPVYAVAATFDAYVQEAGITGHSFTIETFSEEPMERRVLADVISIWTVLESYR